MTSTAARSLDYGFIDYEYGVWSGTNETRVVSGRQSLGSFTTAWTSGTVSTGGEPAARATRLAAPSAPTTLAACNSSRLPTWSTWTWRPLALGERSRNRVS